MKIHSRILIPIYVCLGASFLIVGISVYYTTYQKNLENAFNHLETRSNLTQIIVQNYFSEIREKLSEFSQSSENTQSIIELSKYQLKKNSKEYKNASSNIEQSLLHFTKIYPEVLDISFVDQYGILLSSISGNLPIGTYLDVVYGKGFFKRFQAELFISDIRIKDNNTSYVFASKPIYDGIGTLVGGIIIEFQTMDLDNKILSHSSLGKTGESYILGRDGIIKTSLNNTLIQKFNTKIDTKIYHACFVNENKEIQSSSYNNIVGKEVIGRYQYMTDIDMCIITEIEVSEVLESTKKVMALLGITGVGMLIFMSFLIHLFIRRITRPLHYLTAKIQQIKKSGNKNVTLKKFHNDELGDLSNSFQEMLEELSITDKKIHDTVLSQTQEIRRKQKETIKLNSKLIKFEEALKKASDYIAIFNPQHEILYINTALEKETGYKLKECIGKKSENFWRKSEGRDSMKHIWKQVEKNKSGCNEEIITNRKDGSSFVSQVHMSPILNNDNKIAFFLSIENDITQEKEVKKMKDEFISLVSHELRTPMTVIKGYTQIFLDEKIGTINSQQRKYLERIHGNTESLISMVNDMLDIEKLNSGKMTFEDKPVNINTLISGCIEELSGMCKEKEITLSFQEKKMLNFSSDEKKIKQVLVNFIRNSYKFTPEKGSITISCNKHKGRVRVEVTDTGIGIKKEDFQKIFQKFTQLDSQLQKEHKGTGLGLSICQMIIENLGGEIGFTSKYKFGSTFYFELPLS